MDTQIKIIVNYFKVNNEGKRYDYEYSEHYINASSQRAVFDIEETDNVSIEADFNPRDYKIEIESAASGELIDLKPRTEHDLHLWDEELAFFPGYFDLYVTANNLRKRYCFCVHPKQLELKNVFYLRSYVNDYYDGMSLDLEKKRKMEVAFDDRKMPSNSFTSYSFLVSNFPDVINYMNRYVKLKHEQISKKETTTNNISKISPKTIKWLAKKGYSKNKNINEPETIISQKTYFTLNNEQNRVFKSYVAFWNGELNAHLSRLLEYQKKTEINIESLKKEAINLRNEIVMVSPIKTITKFAKKQMQGNLDEIEEQISTLLNSVEDYKNRYLIIKRFKTYVENVRFNTWVNTIEEEPNYSHKKIISKELLMIKEIKDRYIGIKRRVTYGKNKKIDYFAEKSTPKLFETYLYVLLINIIKNHGYEIDETLIPLGDMMYALTSQSKIILSNKSGSSCELMYDKPLEDADKEFVENDYCTINSSHNRPDFILSFKDGDGKLCESLIVEAKWRRLENIYNEHGETDVSVNLKDYSNLGYYDSESGRIKRGVISKVLAIYPDVEERTQSLLSGLISYYGLNICKEIETTKNYALLDSVISSMLQK